MKLQKYSDFSFLMKMMCLFVLLFLGYQLRQPGASLTQSEIITDPTSVKTEYKATNISWSNILVAEKMPARKN